MSLFCQTKYFSHWGSHIWQVSSNSAHKGICTLVFYIIFNFILYYNDTLPIGINHFKNIYIQPIVNQLMQYPNLSAIIFVITKVYQDYYVTAAANAGFKKRQRLFMDFWGKKQCANTSPKQGYWHCLLYSCLSCFSFLILVTCHNYQC